MNRPEPMANVLELYKTRAVLRRVTPAVDSKHTDRNR